ncbi:hypothetical protein E8L99_07310 [Phreatobacter aquaticus]|uniref:Protein kinase domain-containing protein n=1 Tax=Phreatobacter aquaticus TaxID=2570229 RepID=A0A4D7QIL3_9HYPH|nr:hypothetical protein [Phreatobacter aquaticus]QCK85589.1 hypothetical protein E8L99_07310 [Phreatobacter aquaticus]
MSIFDGTSVRFGIPAGFRVGHYEIGERLGSGWTAESYRCHEVPTGAVRAFKIYDRFDERQAIQNLRVVAHYATVLEQLGDLRILPRYHHMGHLFLNGGDGIGHTYLIQELIERGDLALEQCSVEQVRTFLAKVREVHRMGLALGDIERDNLIVTPSGEIRMVDCDYGRPGRPNTRTGGDVLALRRLFKPFGFNALWAGLG